MSCPYSDQELAFWDSVCNPIGDACYSCDDCQCEHWSGSCPEDCDGYKCEGEGLKFQEHYVGEEKSAREVSGGSKQEGKKEAEM